MNSPSNARFPWPAFVGAGALYLVFALYQLYPAWLAPDHGVVGDWLHPDMISNHWLYRWVADSLRDGQSILHNDRYYFPVGDGPFLAGNGSDAVLAAPLGILLRWPFSVTAWCVLLVVGNGLAGWTLARAFGSRPAGSLLAGAVLATLPYVLYELSCARIAQAPLLWFAFFLAAWWRHLEAPSWGRGVLAGLLYGVCAFAYWYYGLWAALVGGILFLVARPWKALWSFVPVALATTVPPLALFLAHWSQIPGTVEEAFPHALAIESALPFTFPIWGGSGPRHGLILPLLLPVLALPALKRPWSRTTRALLAAAGLFYLLTLGPHLLLPNEKDTGMPGPFLLLYAATATLRRYWWPYRHEAVVALVLAPLMALGASRWLESRFPRRGAWVALGLSLLLPLEIHLRGGTTHVAVSWWEIPEAYTRFNELGEGVLAEVPLSPSLARSQQALSYQWVHGRTLVNGHAMWVDRVRPDAWDQWVEGHGFLKALQAYESGRNEQNGLIFDAADIGRLRDEGVRYLVVNSEYFPGRMMLLVPRYHAIFEALFGKPVMAYRDLVLVWDLDKFRGLGEVDVPAFDPEASAVSDDGTVMPEAGPVHSLGWRPFPRNLPPIIPPNDPGADERYDELPDMLKRKLRRTDLSPPPVRRSPQQAESKDKDKDKEAEPQE